MTNQGLSESELQLATVEAPLEQPAPPAPEVEKVEEAPAPPVPPPNLDDNSLDIHRDR